MECGREESEGCGVWEESKGVWNVGGEKRGRQNWYHVIHRLYMCAARLTVRHALLVTVYLMYVHTYICMLKIDSIDTCLHAERFLMPHTLA